MPVNPMLIWMSMALAGALLYCASLRLQAGKVRAGCRLLAFTVASVGVNQISYASHFAPVGEAPGVLWLNSGLLVAVLVAVERRWYPAYVFAAVLVHLHSGMFLHDLAWTTSAFWTTANVAEGVVGSLLLRRAVAGKPDITQPRTFVLFIVLCAGVATALSAAIGTAALALFRSPSDWFGYWQVWWVSNAIGVLSLGPALLAWNSDGRPERVPRRWPNYAEAVAMPLLLVATTLVAVGPFNLGFQSVLDFPYLVVPLLVWAAMRFEARFATGAALFVAIVIVFTANGTFGQLPGIPDNGLGPFRDHGRTVESAVLAIQAFLFVSLLTTQILVNLNYQRQRAEHERLAMSDQLYEAQRMESVAHLAGGVAHDLNNLLAVIAMYRDQVEERVGDDPALTPALEAMDDAAGNAVAMSRSLLDLSSQDTIEPGPLNPGRLLERTLQVCRPLLPRTIRVQMEIDLGRDFVIQGDANHLQQVILNLVLNARDAMTPGGGTLSIWARHADQSMDQIEIGVSDTGEGISPEHLEHVFEPLFTTKPPGKGTGLGLSIVKRIVDAHAGTIAIDSTPGQGTTVKLRLPLGPADPQHDKRTHPFGGLLHNASPTDGNDDNQGKARGIVLVYIENPQIRGAVLAELCDQGWQTQTCHAVDDFLSSAQEAKQNDPPARAIVDLRPIANPEAITQARLPIPTIALCDQQPPPILADPDSRIITMPFKIKFLVDTAGRIR